MSLHRKQIWQNMDVIYPGIWIDSMQRPVIQITDRVHHIYRKGSWQGGVCSSIKTNIPFHSHHTCTERWFCCELPSWRADAANEHGLGGSSDWGFVKANIGDLVSCQFRSLSHFLNSTQVVLSTTAMRSSSLLLVLTAVLVSTGDTVLGAISEDTDALFAEASFVVPPLLISADKRSRLLRWHQDDKEERGNVLRASEEMIQRWLGKGRIPAQIKQILKVTDQTSETDAAYLLWRQYVSRYQAEYSQFKPVW